MIDVHCHLVHRIDDGPSSIDESLRMICEAEEAGVKVLFATPHYRDSSFDREAFNENFQALLYRARDFNVTLKQGLEVSFNPFLSVDLKAGNALLLGKSRYMLLELSSNTFSSYSQELIYRLQLTGVTIIMAHPERERFFTNNFSTFTELVKRGCLVQLDSASILGIHGDMAKKFSRQLIKMNLAHFVASDAHSAKDYAGWYLKAYQKVCKWAGEEYADKLFIKNAVDILDSEKENHINLFS